MNQRAVTRILQALLAGLVLLVAWPTLKPSIDAITGSSAQGETSDGSGELPPIPDGPATRVLFLGNSLTYSNGMPETIRRLAASDGLSLEFEQHTPGGRTLAEHATDPAVRDLVARGNWDVVVLQEQSVLPSLERSVVEDAVIQPLRVLSEDIRRRNPSARIVLYQTPARQSGALDLVPDLAELGSYEGMQRRIIAGYATMARAIRGEIAPAGEAWRRVRQTRPTLELYADPTHPNRAGSYLIACVLYASIFNGVPPSTDFDADLDGDLADFLQSVGLSARG